MVLKNIIKCGKFLHLNVKKYEEKLKRLNQKSKILKITKKQDNIIPNTKKHPKKKYIKVISNNPLIITLPSNTIKYWIFKNKFSIFDIPYAIISKNLTKKIDGIKIKISQFNKKTVRVVIYKKKVKYEIKNKKLIV
jgi:N-acetylmuramoyl-L-alanine amidase